MQATMGTNAYISRKAFDDCLLQVPSLAVQKLIADELDCAYGFLNCLKKERDARRKQFAYYRDRLLDFPEKVTA
jgi:restriction endonuclease S subunit